MGKLSGGSHMGVPSRLDKGGGIRAYAQQQLSSVTADQWDGNLFKGLECAFLARSDIDELGNVDHACSKYIIIPVSL